MNKRIKKSAKALVMAFLLSVMLVPVAAKAEEVPAEDILQIPVTVNVTGEAPADAAYEFRIESMTEGAPMPANDTLAITGTQEKDGVKTGTGTFVFGPDAFPIPNDYNYKITQISKNFDGLKNLDDTVFYVTVRVLNDENGNRFAVWARKDGKDQMYNTENEWGKDSIVFTDEFNPPEVPQEISYTTVKKNGVKTGDSANVLLWSTMALASVFCIGFLVFRRRRD